MNIRKAAVEDLSRIAEIYVFNNRINYFPIFMDEVFSFRKLQVVTLVDNYFSKSEILDNLYVFDNGLILGFLQVDKREICKLYVEPFFQSKGVGNALIEYAINLLGTTELWALEKNIRAIAFYKKHGFNLTKEKKFEDGTSEYLVKLVKGLH